MTLSELCIRRPVMTTLVMAGMLIFGMMAYKLLPVSDLPNVDFPVILVQAQLPGASPETMASAVATPLERQFSQIAGVQAMSSENRQGMTTIVIQLSLERTLDAGAQDVQAAITQAQGLLPPEMPNPPTFRKVNPADQPILYLSLESPTLPLAVVDEYADTVLAQRISTIDGVAQVQIYGAQKYAVRVQLDPDKLAYRGIGVDEVANAVRAANVNLPTGTIDGRHQAYTIEADGQLKKASLYEPVIIAYRNGAPVRIADVGRAIDSVEADKVASWHNRTRAIVLAISRQPGTNTIAVVDRVMATMPSFQAQLPAAVKLDVLFDRSESIRESFNDVQITLLITIVLVIVVIFLFLRNLSATVIPSLAVPLSIVGTFAGMYLLGFSMDNMSLMALTLSVGFVVDDAIVMLENIVRHMEEGKAPLAAAMDGSKQIAFTILSMTLSLAAVFLPVLFMGGLIGRLLHEFAVVIALAILVSGFVSLTLTPMLCARFLRPGGQAHHGRFYAASEKFFDGMLALYEWSLRGVLRHRFVTLLASLVVIVLTVQLFRVIPAGFLPSEDISRIFCPTEGPENISFQSMVEHQQALAQIIEEDPNVDSFFSVVGFNGRNTGMFFMKLKPRHERALSVEHVINNLRPKFAAVPGIAAYPNNPPPINPGGRMTNATYQYTLQSTDTADLYRAAGDMLRAMREMPELADVSTDLKLSNPKIALGIDRDKAKSLGLTPQQIEDALYTAYGSRQVSTIYATQNQYDVITELLPQYQQDPNSLAKLYLRGTKSLVPLDTIVQRRNDVAPLSVNHQGQLPAVTVSFNLKPGGALGAAVQQIEQTARQKLPPTVTAGFQGTAQAFQSSQQGLGLLLIFSVVVIYMILGILYESYIHPITILSGLPSAGLGALLTLWVFNVELSLYAFVGIIMLVGIVKKNAIMMIDFAVEAERNHGKSPYDAIFEGCLVRFRPIMMTTAAAFMGTLPIALGLGAGAESRRPLGLAVCGGLLVSQLITLYLTPVIYVYFESLRGFFARFRKAPTPVPAPTTQA